MCAQDREVATCGATWRKEPNAEGSSEGKYIRGLGHGVFGELNRSNVMALARASQRHRPPTSYEPTMGYSYRGNGHFGRIFALELESNRPRYQYNLV